MAVTAKHFTPEDQQAFIEKHPKGQPKEWAVWDEGLVIEWVDTQKEAEQLAEGYNKDDSEQETIEDSFRDWLIDTEETTGIDENRIRQLVKEYLI